MQPSTSTTDATVVQKHTPGSARSVHQAYGAPLRPARDGAGLPGRTSGASRALGAPASDDLNAATRGSGATPAANSPMGELAQLMEEPAGGGNHGRALSTNPNVEGRYIDLETEKWRRNEYLRTRGFIVVNPRRAHHGATAGMSSHVANQHTVLHPEEYFDAELASALVEDELGFTVEQLHSVYCTGGRIASSLQELRAAMDARLLELANGGANMNLFGRLMGINESTLDRALARARATEGN